MTITTVTRREVNQDVARTKRAAKSEPVFITDRGKPDNVLLSIEDYHRLAREGRGCLKALSMERLAGIDENPPGARIKSPHTHPCCCSLFGTHLASPHLARNHSLTKTAKPLSYCQPKTTASIPTLLGLPSYQDDSNQNPHYTARSVCSPSRGSWFQCHCHLPRPITPKSNQPLCSTHSGGSPPSG